VESTRLPVFVISNTAGSIKTFHIRLLEYITLRRPELEIVYEWNEKTVLIRGSERTPLPTVPDTATSHADTTGGDSSPKDDEDASDSEEECQITRKARTAREKARAMGRRIRYLGAQNSINELFDREIDDLEMQTSSATSGRRRGDRPKGDGGDNTGCAGRL
jgi:hypothetical protein